MDIPLLPFPLYLTSVLVILFSVLAVLLISRAGRIRTDKIQQQHKKDLDLLRRGHNKALAEAKSVREKAQQEEKATRDRSQADFESRLEQQREIARIAASISKEQAKKLEFFTDLAQEFRTPLNQILDALEKVHSGDLGKIPGRLKNPLNAVLRDSRQLLRYMDQFHDISKLQSGRMDLKASLNNVNKFIREIAQSFNWYAQRKEIHLDLKLPESDVFARFDDQKMATVLYHLITNAFKFSETRGKVLIAVSHSDAQEDAEGSVVIKVRNTGIIPAERVPHLFDAFHQLEMETKERIRIGLSLVKELINLHGGTIAVRSEPEVGTEFTIRLPVVNAPSSEELEEREYDFSRKASLELSSLESQEPLGKESDAIAQSSQSLNARKILIVEDNDNIRQLLRGGFTKQFMVLEAANGLDGLQKVKDSSPDIIIADIMMPEMDGLDFCRSVKTNEKLNHIPIILLTAKSDETARMEGFEAGADAYISKPFNFDELTEKVEFLMKQSPLSS